MSLNAVKDYLKPWGRDKDIVELDTSTATVALAAAALGVEPARIAKSITVRGFDGAIMVVAAGDARVDNKKFKSEFTFSPRLLSADEAQRQTGFAVGGICPFALPDSVAVYLDQSLKRFASVFPACGTASSLIEVSPDELEHYSQAIKWIDVCKLM